MDQERPEETRRTRKVQGPGGTRRDWRTARGNQKRPAGAVVSAGSRLASGLSDDKGPLLRTPALQSRPGVRGRALRVPPAGAGRDQWEGGAVFPGRSRDRGGAGSVCCENSAAAALMVFLWSGASGHADHRIIRAPALQRTANGEGAAVTGAFHSV
ncbi:unnamed protein product [Gadus morhua 'NCC']